jgi:hypothetical protein
MLHDQRHHAKRREVPGSNPGEIFWSFRATCSFCSLSFSLGSTRTVTKISTEVLPWRIIAVGVESSVVLVCAEYEIKNLNPTFYRPLSLRDLLWETFTFHIVPFVVWCAVCVCVVKGMFVVWCAVCVCVQENVCGVVCCVCLCCQGNVCGVVCCVCLCSGECLWCSELCVCVCVWCVCVWCVCACARVRAWGRERERDQK